MFSVIFGAFGAHKLKKMVNQDLLHSFETGIKHQMYHAVVLLTLGFNLPFETGLENKVIYLFIAGTILFSFSIYGLVLSAVKGNKWKFLGPVTPIGGLLLIVGWGLLLYHFLNN